MSEGNDNLKLWNAVCKTDPKMTKPFNNGTYSGTAIDPQYQFQRATEAFGPFGVGWRVDGAKYEIIDADETTKVMLFTGSLAYELDSSWGLVPITSSVKFVYKAKSGRLIVDVEASKKVLTNAIGKGLSRLGFNADVYLGKFDDNSYVDMLGIMEAINETEIDERDVEIAKEMIEKTGSDLDKVLAHVGAESIELMTQAQFSKLIQAMKKKLGAK